MFSDVPILLSSMLEDRSTPASIFDQHFGLGLLPDDLALPTHFLRLPAPRGYYRPWRIGKGRDSGVSNIASTNNEFRVNLDVQQFKPEQLSVKVVDDSVVIEGKHEERQDEHGFISRQFQRRYVIPPNVDASAIQSNLSSDGVLTITAPKKLPTPKNERVIAIVQTNQPASQAKITDKSKSGAEGETMES